MADPNRWFARVKSTSATIEHFYVESPNAEEAVEWVKDNYYGKSSIQMVYVWPLNEEEVKVFEITTTTEIRKIK